ncbi:MAG: cytochrome C oxidase subunit IV family protein [Actinomycetota bacterium]
MSETVTEAHAADEAHDHPSDWAYVKIALLLAFITAVEVATYFESVLTVFENNSVTIASLMIMMVVKFYLVAMYFMHLKHDNPIFTRMFVGGLILATVVYIIALAAFEFWA